MYLELPLEVLSERARSSTPGSFSDAHRKRRLERVGRAEAPSLALNEVALEAFRDSSVRRPYDVFLIHTGSQKRGEVATMSRLFSERGFRFFWTLKWLLDPVLGPKWRKHWNLVGMPLLFCPANF